MSYNRLLSPLLAALLGMGSATALANDAHAPAAKPAAAESHAAPAAAPAAHGASEAKAPEALSPSIHPLRRPVVHAAAPVHAATAHASARPAAKSAHAAAPHGKAAHGKRPATGKAGHGAEDGHEHEGETGKVKGLVDAMLAANSNYMKRNNAAYFDRFAGKQTPRATVVTCADSRVQSNAFHADAVNDLFMVRNIGNQLATSEGSVEYGVRHLNTPLLVFIGHAVCGAIAAASGDFSKLERPIQRELLTINIPKGINVNEGVLMNVNNQVDAAMMKFGGEIEAGKLAVIGAFYDFRNDYKQGKGKLIITNINGETDPAKLAALTKAGNFFNAATGMAATAGGGH